MQFSKMNYQKHKI